MQLLLQQSAADSLGEAPAPAPTASSNSSLEEGSRGQKRKKLPTQRKPAEKRAPKGRSKGLDNSRPRGKDSRVPLRHGEGSITAPRGSGSNRGPGSNSAVSTIVNGDPGKASSQRPTVSSSSTGARDVATAGARDMATAGTGTASVPASSSSTSAAAAAASKTALTVAATETLASYRGENTAEWRGGQITASYRDSALVTSAAECGDEVEGSRDGGVPRAAKVSATTPAGSVAAQAAAVAEAERSRLLERYKREEQQRLHSVGMRQQRTLQQAGEQRAFGQQQFQRDAHLSSKTVPPTLADHHLPSQRLPPPQKKPQMTQQTPLQQPVMQSQKQQQQHLLQQQHSQPPKANSHILHATKLATSGRKVDGAAVGTSLSRNPDALQRQFPAYGSARQQQPQYQQPVGSVGLTQTSDVTYIRMPSTPALAGGDGSGGGNGTGNDNQLDVKTICIHRTTMRDSSNTMSDPFAHGAGSVGRLEGSGAIGGSAAKPISPRDVMAGGSDRSNIVSAGEGGIHEAPHHGTGTYAPSWGKASSAIRSQPTWSAMREYGGDGSADGGSHIAAGHPSQDQPVGSSRPPAAQAPLVKVKLPGFGTIAAGAGIHVHQPHSSGARVSLYRRVDREL